MTGKEAEVLALQYAKELGDVLYKQIPGAERGDGALRALTLGALIALATKNQDKKFYTTLRQTVDHFTGVLEGLVEAHEEHMKTCPGRTKH
jgi:hypothetical protein